jgi:NADPH-dependent curcumin reductase CurA
MLDINHLNRQETYMLSAAAGLVVGMAVLFMRQITARVFGINGPPAKAEEVARGPLDGTSMC